MDVARKHTEWQVQDKCGNRIVKIILERVQAAASGQKSTNKSHETLSSRNILCRKIQDESLQTASRPSSEPGSGPCSGLSNRPQRNKKKNYKHFFDGGSSSEKDDDIRSDASDSNLEPSETSDCELQLSTLNKVKWKPKSSKKISTHVLHVKTRRSQTQTKAVPCLKCDVCFKKFQTPLALENHIIRFHVVDNPFKCELCCKYFFTQRRLQQHSQRMHKHKNSQRQVNKNNLISWLQCELCPYKCTTQNGLERHIIQVHVVDKPFKCGICNKSFMIDSALRDHVRLTHTNKNFNCKLCPTQPFKDTASLKKHADTVHMGCSDHSNSEVNGDSNICPVCDTWFLTDAELAKHLKKPKSESVLKCDICSELVYTPCRLNLHRQKKHNENLVAKGSRKSNKLEAIVEFPHEKQRHQSAKITKTSASVKNQVSPKKFSCSVCSAFFSQRSDLDRHELQENHRCWKCPICAKVFTWPGVLKRHIQAVHSDARPFKCKFKGCSKSYKELRVLKKHMDMHDPDSYYIECDVCSKKFGTRQSMKQHLVTHTDERPFPCKFCDSKYKFLRVANQHMKKCEFMSEDRRKKFSKRSRMVMQQAKTWKPKIFILGKWRKLTDQPVKLDETTKATSTSTSELTSDTTSLNGNGADLKLLKQDTDLKLIKPEADLKLIKPEADLKLIKPEADLKLIKPEADLKLIKPEADLKLIKPEADFKVIKPEADFKLIKPEADLADSKLTKQEVDLKYFGINSSDFDNSPEPGESIVKLEIIPEQEICTYSD